MVCMWLRLINTLSQIENSLLCYKVASSLTFCLAWYDFTQATQSKTNQHANIILYLYIINTYITSKPLGVIIIFYEAPQWNEKPRFSTTKYITPPTSFQISHWLKWHHTTAQYFTILGVCKITFCSNLFINYANKPEKNNTYWRIENIHLTLFCIVTLNSSQNKGNCHYFTIFHCLSVSNSMSKQNKRAQRALGRSPEEKVKGKRSQWSNLQRTTNIVHQILEEDL